MHVFSITMDGSSKSVKKEIDEAFFLAREFKIPVPEDEFFQEHRYLGENRIHRVPHHLRSRKLKEEEDYYTPKMVSFGPYHYGLHELCASEKFKPIILKTLVSSSYADIYNKIFEVIDQVRNCYVGISKEKYDDKSLTEMMLLDTCFLIYVMKFRLKPLNYPLLTQYLGVSGITLALRDIYLLENQIPLSLIKRLINLINKDGEEESTLICNFLSTTAFEDKRLKSIPRKNDKEPLHLLDVLHLVFANGSNNAREPVKPFSKCKWLPRWLCTRKEDQSKFGLFSNQFRSVTDLKAKGIYVKPSSYCLKDINFESYPFSGQLQLPIWYFSAASNRLLSNMIVHELSMGTVEGMVTLIYVNFLKSLVVRVEDVRELREKKVIFTGLENDEQVLKVIKEIDAGGIHYAPLLEEVKKKIEDHCSSKARTWFAELKHSYFRSPWTLIGLITAIVLLCLTVVQTYYAMHPASPAPARSPH
ncbi:Hypothetical predicted protein [Olea europaea subsp. europaea]|uniref:Uncharacterized protein n=1 Tax=Olea europaea subsp. europaea TaxID=158383 RepID=A0A8S0QXX9_OLEEU|nr:Hypothetical predicted protein [Olea europaea subsp. europaea]